MAGLFPWRGAGCGGVSQRESLVIVRGGFSFRPEECRLSIK